LVEEDLGKINNRVNSVGHLDSDTLDISKTTAKIAPVVTPGEYKKKQFCYFTIIRQVSSL